MRTILHTSRASCALLETAACGLITLDWALVIGLLYVATFGIKGQQRRQGQRSHTKNCTSNHFTNWVDIKKQVDPMEDSQQIFLFSGVLTSVTQVGPADTMFARLRTAMSIQLVEYSTTHCEGSVLAPPPRRHCLDLPRCPTRESKVASKVTSKVSAATEACHHSTKILS
jgi:hypothetical protein